MIQLPNRRTPRAQHGGVAMPGSFGFDWNGAAIVYSKLWMKNLQIQRSVTHGA
jgi:hypothetical protein